MKSAARLPREAQLCMEMIADTFLPGSPDVMELNPAVNVVAARPRWRWI